LKITLAVLLLFASSVLPAQTSTRQGQLIQVHPSTEPAPAQSSIDPAKETDIRQLLELTHAGDVAIQAMTGMEGNMKLLLTHSLPPGEYRERLVDLFFLKFKSKIAPAQIVDLIVPVYDKYFSDQEIKDLIRFYGTPTGQKMAGVQGQLAAELQQTGSKWGEELGRQSMIEVLSEHPDLAKALQDAKRPALPQ
jgi:uncharacterized protein